MQNVTERVDGGSRYGASRYLLRGATPTSRRAIGLTDDPGQSRLDGTDALVEIMAVETHARFEAERVPGPETDELDVGVTREKLGELHGVLWRDRNLKSMCQTWSSMVQPNDLTLRLSRGLRPPRSRSRSRLAIGLALGLALAFAFATPHSPRNRLRRCNLLEQHDTSPCPVQSPQMRSAQT